MIIRLRNLIRICQLCRLLIIFCPIFALTLDGAEPIVDSALPTSDPQSKENANANRSERKVDLDGPQLPDSPTWSEILRAVILTAIPDKYEELRHWGQTNEVFSGVRVQQRGFNIRVSERKATVNQGAWHRYKIELIDPAKTLKIIIEQVQPMGTGEFQFQIRLASKLRCRADFEHWVLGVKGLNFTVVSDADIQIIANCHLKIRRESNRARLLPDLVLEPRVNNVQLFLTNLEVRRIGEIRGDLAEGIGDTSRHYIENLLQTQEGRAVKKANEAIDKKRSQLRIPTSWLW